MMEKKYQQQQRASTHIQENRNTRRVNDGEIFGLIDVEVAK